MFRVFFANFCFIFGNIVNVFVYSEKNWTQRFHLKAMNQKTTIFSQNFNNSFSVIKREEKKFNVGFISEADEKRESLYNLWEIFPFFSSFTN